MEMQLVEFETWLNGGFCLGVVLLLVKRGGLSLTSLSVTLMVVVEARPPSCPPMSLAWRRTWYSLFISRSMLAKAVLITPERFRRSLSGFISSLLHHRGNCYIFYGWAPPSVWICSRFLPTLGFSFSWISKILPDSSGSPTTSGTDRRYQIMTDICRVISVDTNSKTNI